MSNQPSKPDERTPSHYIAIGASAGGLEAIESFFMHMPAENPYGFMVIQHLSPDYKSLMVEILSKRTTMPVHRVEDGMAVEPGNVYLIPPKKNMTIFHGKLLLNDQDQARGLNLPIDVFLQSLAEDQGEKAIGIILSGTGSDGMRGVRAIKECGGMIMVQNEASAKFDGMPQAAISTGLVDFILAPDEMPDQLQAFVSYPAQMVPIHPNREVSDDDGLTQVFALLRERCKVDFTHYKPSTVHRRLERRMTVNQISTIHDYIRQLREVPAEVTTLFRELLIGVTSFFRDPAVWEKLETELLPELVRSTEFKELRLWVAGCSTGEEAYTLAMVVRKVMDDIGITRDVKIFATDIDKEATLYAAAGSYPESIAADVPAHYLSRYFFRKDEHFQISRSIREMVVFAQHNLIKDPPFTNIDLISCRNLLIYLQPVLQNKVMEYFHFSSRNSGLVVLGSSETTGEMSEFFEPIDQKAKIYRSRGNVRRAIEPVRAMLPSDTRLQDLHRSITGDRRMADHRNEQILERFLETVAGQYLPVTAIVNDQLEILHVVGDTAPYFRFPSGRPSLRIDKLAVRELAIPVSTGVQKVIRTGKDLQFTGILLKGSDSVQSINLRIVPIPGKKSQSPLVGVFLENVGRKEPDPPDKSELYDVSLEAEQRIRDLEQELQFSRENLQATIEELETANEELQATNEELLASNEELQSTNEELQSTNEELYTVNTEYHSKIIELTEAHNDVDNLMTASQIGTLLLDENLEIRRFSPRITAIFKLLDADEGRPITHIAHYLQDFDPLTVLQNVQKSEEVWEDEVQTEDGTWYLMRVVPYTIGPGVFSGLVVTCVDVNRLKSTERELAKREAILEASERLAEVGGWEYDVGMDTMFWTDETYRIHGFDPASFNPGTKEHIDRSLECYPEDERLKVFEAFGLCLEKGTPYDMVVRFLRADGKKRWIRTAASSVMENGSVVRIVGNIMDITNLRCMDEDE